MSDQILPQTTAGINPEKFSDNFFPNRKLLIALLFLCLVAGFALRVSNLGAESLSEDELNKLETVADYRANGLSGRNGEHPFLMKGLQTVSIIASEKLNDAIFSASPNRRISEESALRFPTVLFGTFTALLIFLVISELFGTSIGLLAAALWSVDPNAVGFDRVAKEDSFLLFFFLLMSFFWIRSQTKAQRGGDSNWTLYAWLAAASFGGLMASKYLPHLLGVPAAYHKIFHRLSDNNWTFDRYAWLKFFIIAGICFLILNPTILLPETWREMLTFSAEKRIGHDSYEFMGELYRNRITLWLYGVPWTFYYVFILVKTPILTLISFLAGLLLIFRRKMGDGRFFILIWILMWFLPFTFLGGKFMRYFTVAQPLVLIIAAVGCYFAGRWTAEKLFSDSKFRAVFSWGLPLILVIASFIASLTAAPHFRLFTNTPGGGTSSAGFYFPHDEFYDAATRETIDAIIAQNPRQGAVIASETPGLFEHYIKKSARPDLISVSLSDDGKAVNLSAGDYVAAARGRRYFSNDAVLKYLKSSLAPVAEVNFGSINAVTIYRLDGASAEKIHESARQ
ncbi:MAG: glycosyltransferase family 39 protein [Pyrinomonadaceae bacterium]